MKKILCKEPWPANPIDQYQAVEDGAWGYLLIYNDLSFCFDTTSKPGVAEILTRWPQLKARQPTAVETANQSSPTTPLSGKPLSGKPLSGKPPAGNPSGTIADEPMPMNQYQ